MVAGGEVVGPVAPGDVGPADGCVDVEAEEVGQDRGRDVLQERDEGCIASWPGVDPVVKELAAEPGRGSRAPWQQAREEPARPRSVGVDPGLPGRAFPELTQQHGQLGRDQQRRRSDVEVRLASVLAQMIGVEVTDA